MNLKQYLQKITNPTKMRPPAQRGQSMVEFALLLPLLLLIVFGVADLGRAFQALIAVTNASREGARQGVFYPEAPELVAEAAINEATQYGIDVLLEDITISTGGCTYTYVVNNQGDITWSVCTYGNPYVVTVCHDFDLITGLLPGYDIIRICRDTKMRLQCPVGSCN